MSVLLLLLGLTALPAAPVELPRQTIALPAATDRPLFADVGGDGRCHLLVLDLAEGKILNYPQRRDGFTNFPDQMIPLPPRTAWAAVCDVDAHPGLELLFSTATGLVYSRQDAGRFESTLRTLIATEQTFPDIDLPSLTLLSTNAATTNGADDLIPVLTAGRVVPYHRNAAYEWSPGPPMILDTNQTVWHVNGDYWYSRWALGSNPAQCLRVEQFFCPEPGPKRDEEPENEAIRKILADMEAKATHWRSGISRVDVNGDGREDVVLWQSTGELDFRTDIYIFLRRADRKLPERPTQVLHCSGVPIPSDAIHEPSPMHDLNGDGIYELVLLDLTTVFTSPSDLVETALSRGMECSIKIRTLHHGAFSRNLDASVTVRLLFVLADLTAWPFCIQGDFNGDGRSDLLIRRSEHEWNIYGSTRDDRWFAEQPAMAFHAPERGIFHIKDLNGDGLSDIIWFDSDNPELSIYMTPPRRAQTLKPR